MNNLKVYVSGISPEMEMTGFTDDFHCNPSKGVDVEDERERIAESDVCYFDPSSTTNVDLIASAKAVDDGKPCFVKAREGELLPPQLSDFTRVRNMEELRDKLEELDDGE